MSSEEEDYMSDAFLKKCVDSRPGLASRKAQHQYEKEKIQKEANKKNSVVPKSKLEANQREAGLKASISSGSKGFALLQKMGYKPGMGIGKDGSGQVEPVAIEIKNNRSGLGRDTELKRKAKEMNNMRALMAIKRQKAEETQRDTFMGRLKERFSEKNVEKDLRTAQTACLQLDQEKGITEPGEQFFWPVSDLPSHETKDDDDDRDVETLPEYMKKSHSNYGEKIEEISDYDDDDDDGIPPDIPACLEFSELEKLDILTRYLRNTYQYCIWCGIRYIDKQDLDDNCPGNTAYAHE